MTPSSKQQAHGIGVKSEGIGVASSQQTLKRTMASFTKLGGTIASEVIHQSLKLSKACLASMFQSS